MLAYAKLGAKECMFVDASVIYEVALNDTINFKVKIQKYSTSGEVLSTIQNVFATHPSRELRNLPLMPSDAKVLYVLKDAGHNGMQEELNLDNSFMWAHARDQTTVSKKSSSKRDLLFSTLANAANWKACSLIVRQPEAQKLPKGDKKKREAPVSRSFGGTKKATLPDSRKESAKASDAEFLE